MTRLLQRIGDYFIAPAEPDPPPPAPAPPSPPDPPRRAASPPPCAGATRAAPASVAPGAGSTRFLPPRAAAAARAEPLPPLTEWARAPGAPMAAAPSPAPSSTDQSPLAERSPAPSSTDQSPPAAPPPAPAEQPPLAAPRTPERVTADDVGRTDHRRDGPAAPRPGRGAAWNAPAEPPSTAAPAAAEPAPGESLPAVVASAIVFGSPALVIPVAAACAGELRARAHAPAAVLCVWRARERVTPEPAALDPPDEPARPNPAGATTPGARRVVSRLAARDLEAGACGRLAWLALPAGPADAAAVVRRCLAEASVPVVLAVAGPRTTPLDALCPELDLAIAVLPPDADPALRSLVLGTLPVARGLIASPLAPGPPRWAAAAGLGRLRSLPGGSA